MFSNAAVHNSASLSDGNLVAVYRQAGFHPKDSQNVHRTIAGQHVALLSYLFQQHK
jgi:hypothetical protein